MINNISLMRKAKEQLAGNWTNAVVATLIYLVIEGAACSTTIGELILIGPLTFGYVLYMACLADTRVNNFSLLFKGFDRFVETLVAGLIISVLAAVGFALLIVPGIIISCGLSMTFFIMADDPNISGLDALQMSWNMMNGQKMNFFCLGLRFLGWALLCVLTCGIGFLWLQPYMTLAFLNFYRNLRYGTA